MPHPLSRELSHTLTQVREAVEAIDLASVAALATELDRARQSGKNVWLFGNGGSAATASHFANDLAAIDNPGQARLRAVSLADNVPTLTAIANDLGYDEVFAEQLRCACRPGDLAIAFSCSGNSPNVLNGVRVARQLGARVVAFTANAGGQLRAEADLLVVARAEHITQQEDIHLIVCHAIARAFRAGTVSRRPKALILAAGEGTRLRPLTNDSPKPMLPIAGAPLLEHTVNWLVAHGVDDIAINLHHQPHAIPAHFGDGARFGARIVYSREQRLLGTAGAVRGLNGFVERGRPLVVVYGDVLTDLDLGELLAVHERARAGRPTLSATLALYRVPNPTEVGLVDLDADGNVSRFVEKPRADEVFTDLANTGIMVVEPSVVEHIPPDVAYDFGRELFPHLLSMGAPLMGWEVPRGTFVLDIGTPEKYAQAQREWRA